MGDVSGFRDLSGGKPEVVAAKRAAKANRPTYPDVGMRRVERKID